MEEVFIQKGHSKRKKIFITVSLILVFLLILNINVSFGNSSDNHQAPITVGFSNYVTITIGPDTALGASPDYTCDGTSDNVQFQAALNALPANGGKLHILGGQYNFDTTVTRAIDNVVIEGVGYSTYLVYNGATAIFIAGGNRWQFQDIRFDNGYITASTDTIVVRCWDGPGFYDYWSENGLYIYNGSSINTDDLNADGTVEFGTIGDPASVVVTGTADFSGATVFGLSGSGSQNIFASIGSDSGTKVASSTSDTIKIAGGVGIETSVSDNILTITNTGTSAVTQEEIEDYVGAMVSGNTETNIVVEYQDADGTLDFVVTGGAGTYSFTGTMAASIPVVFVAANDATSYEKAKATFQCDGTNDEVQIAAAIDVAGGGKVGLSTGIFEIDADLDIDDAWIIGQGSCDQPWGIGTCGTRLDIDSSAVSIFVTDHGRISDFGVWVASAFSGTAVQVNKVDERVTNMLMVWNNISIFQEGMNGRVGDTGSVGMWVMSDDSTDDGNKAQWSANTADNLAIRGFTTAFIATAIEHNDDDGGYVNGNDFGTMILYGNKDSFVLKEYDIGNNPALDQNTALLYIQYESGAVDGIRLDGNHIKQNFIRAHIWDWGGDDSIEVIDGEHNFFEGQLSCSSISFNGSDWENGYHDIGGDAANGYHAETLMPGTLTVTALVETG